MNKSLSFLFLSFIFVISGCGEKQDWNADKRFMPYLEPGAVAGDFLARTTDNKYLTFSTYSGSPVLLSFFKKSCDECVPILKKLDEAHRDYEKEGLVTIAVNADNLNYVPSSAVLSFVKAQNLSFPILLDDQALAIERYKVISIPATFFIDKDRIISHVAYGEEDLLSPDNRARIKKIME